jgi:hypothetical protein
LGAFLVVGVLSASPAEAFRKQEHRDLSNLALQLALEHQRRMHPDESELWLALEKELLAQGKDATTFGDITRAADFVFEPRKLVPDPDASDILACAQPPKRYRALCAACATGLGDACGKEILAVTQRKLGQRWRWLLVAHTNEIHFDRGAVRTYNDLHQRAVEQVRRWKEAGAQGIAAYRIALRTEAAALHFLEDFFAPGHLMTRRAVHEDLASRSLHNRFNRKGLLARFRTAAMEPLRSTLCDPGRGSADPLAETARLCEAVQEEPICFKGDNRLERSETRAQRLALLLLAAHSITEVLEAGIGGAGDAEPRLRLCYRPWSAVPDHRSGSEAIPVEDSSRPPTGLALVAPDAEAVCRRLTATVAEQDMPETVVALFPSPFETCLSRGLETDGGERGAVGETYLHRTPGFGVSLSFLQVEEGTDVLLEPRRLDIDLVLNALTYREIAKRQGGDLLPNEEKDDERPYQEFQDSGMAWLGGVGLTYQRTGDYEAYGISSAALVPWRPRNLDYYVRLDVGPMRFEGADLQATKLRGGLRLGAGFAFVYAEVGVDYGFRVDRRGHLEDAPQYLVGFRVQLPFEL